MSLGWYYGISSDATIVSHLMLPTPHNGFLLPSLIGCSQQMSVVTLTARTKGSEHISFITSKPLVVCILPVSDPEDPYVLMSPFACSHITYVCEFKDSKRWGGSQHETGMERDSHTMHLPPQIGFFILEIIVNPHTH
jgi:hypothetical protein